jgi:hypothetical protein
MLSGAEWSGPNRFAPRRLCVDTAAARPRYFGRYFLFNAQATENCGSTTFAI